MSIENNDQRPSAWAVFGKIIAILIIVASTLIQLILIKELDAWRGGGPGESHAYAGMSLVMLYVFSFWLVVPGTLLSLIFAARAAFRLRRHRSALAPLIIYLVITSLPGLTLFALIQSDKPRTKPIHIATPVEVKTAGYEWAMSKGIVSKDECNNQGPPNFIIGCKKYIDQQNPAPAEERITRQERAMADGDR